MTGRAEQIYYSATQHANLFSLIQNEMDGPTMTQSLIRYEELKVHFLFPNVDDNFRALLLKLAVRRLGMVVCRNSPDSAGKHELARDFETFSKDAQTILDDLLPVQAEIVKEKYLKPPPGADFVPAPKIPFPGNPDPSRTRQLKTCNDVR